MRSKKDKDTVVIVSADSSGELQKVIADNADNWQVIRKEDTDSLLEGFPEPQNRAERRGNKQKRKKHQLLRGEQDG